MLIDILGKYKVKATFFVVGDWVDKYPESVKALHDAGHEVMNHSNTHAHMSQLSKDEIIADVEACNDKIEAVTGVRPTLIRPPYGEYDDNVITAIRSIGMEPIPLDGFHPFYWDGTHPVGCGQPGLEGPGGAGDHQTGDRKSSVRLHCSVPQCRTAHTGGSANHY